MGNPACSFSSRISSGVKLWPIGLQRFNRVIALSKRANLRWRRDPGNDSCLRAALMDPHAWVRGEALDALSRTLTEVDRPVLKDLLDKETVWSLRDALRRAIRRLDERIKPEAASP